MLTLYLACLLFGGILILVAIFAGGHGDLDVHSDLDFHADMEAHPDIPHSLHGIGELHSDISPHGEGLAAASRFISFRNVIFFVAFFGLTGTVLNALGFGGVLTAVMAILLGFFASSVTHKVFRYLKETESGAGFDEHELQGLTARVEVTVSKTSKGKISVVAHEQHHQLIALVAEENDQESIAPGTTVIVVKVENGIASVANDAYLRS